METQQSQSLLKQNLSSETSCSPSQENLQQLMQIRRQIQRDLNHPEQNLLIDEIYCKINQLIINGQQQHLQFVVTALNKLFKNGNSYGILNYNNALLKLMNFFNQKAEEIYHNKKNRTAQTEYHMLQVLALFGHLLYEHPCFQFPFTRKFLQNVFMIDAELTEICTRRKQIMRILSIIMLIFSKKIELLKKLKLLASFKAILVQHYHLLDPNDTSTFLRFHAALRNLSKEIPITNAQMKKYKITETECSFEKGGVYLGEQKKKLMKVVILDPNLKRRNPLTG